MPTLHPIRLESGCPRLLAGLRRQHPNAGAAASIPEQWRAFRALGELPGQIGDCVYGALCGHGPDQFEYLCAVEVASFAGLAPELGRMRLQEQDYAIFLHLGPAASLRDTWRAAFAWLEASPRFTSAQRPDFELYGPDFDPRTGRGDIELWIAVVPR